MNNFSMFLGDEYLGDGKQTWPENIHYFCKECGTIWARTIASVPADHWTNHGFCPEHDTHHWGPAILCVQFRFQAIVYPIQALARDFLYLMDWKDGQVIHYNLPEFDHDQHQAA